MNAKERDVSQNSCQHTQNSDYIKLIRHRIENVDLT